MLEIGNIWKFGNMFSRDMHQAGEVQAAGLYIVCTASIGAKTQMATRRNMLQGVTNSSSLLPGL